MLTPWDKCESGDATLTPLTLDDEGKRHAALWVCDQAGRGLDESDPQQLRQAAAIAEPVLNMLGLVGDDTWRPSPTAARTLTNSRSEHGTEAGVAYHREAGTVLCAPCRRWLEVDARRRGVAIKFVRPPFGALTGKCGTHNRWHEHVHSGEVLDPACRMYADWSVAKANHQKYTGPLAAHEIDKPLAVHMDGTPCTARKRGTSCVAGKQCTGLAGWLLSCSCGHAVHVATGLGWNDMQQEHRRQVILRAISETN